MSIHQNQKKSVVVVDDSPLMRQVLSSILADSGLFDVVGVASDPIEAREIIRETSPDVITLDVEMPRMDGISFLEKLMRLKPTPTVMISSLTTQGADVTLQALELGAVECIAKPTGSIKESFIAAKDQLVDIVYTAANARVMAGAKAPMPKAPLVKKRVLGGAIDIVGIGASTGGVAALHDVIPHLPQEIPPVVIVQHMPELFVPRFADRLNSNARVTVKVADHGEVLRAGHVYIAPGSDHLEITKKASGYQTTLVSKDPVSGHRPSVDVLFQSLAHEAGDRAIGLIMTGMGKDGADGLKKMRDAGARTLAQNAMSSTVYGMNRAAVENGAVEREVDVQKLAASICDLL